MLFCGWLCINLQNFSINFWKMTISFLITSALLKFSKNLIHCGSPCRSDHGRYTGSAEQATVSISIDCLSIQQLQSQLEYFLKSSAKDQAAQTNQLAAGNDHAAINVKLSEFGAKSEMINLIKSTSNMRIKHGLEKDAIGLLWCVLDWYRSSYDMLTRFHFFLSGENPTETSKTHGDYDRDHTCRTWSSPNLRMLWVPF